MNLDVKDSRSNWVVRMTSHLLVQTSGKWEYYTPKPIVEAARQLMGAIDLDPASSERANNLIVHAERFYTAKDNGLALPWTGRVWMNHPFHRQWNKDWINKLIQEYTDGNIEQACCITYAATSEGWYRPLARFPQLFLAPRTNYLLPDLTVLRGAQKGSVVTYLYPRKKIWQASEVFRIFKGMGDLKW